MSNWNQPICEDCYEGRYPGRMPYRMKEEWRQHEEQCCDCGKKTCGGIYCRIDPVTVRFPAPDEQATVDE